MARTHKQNGSDCNFEVSLGKNEMKGVIVPALKGEVFKLLLGHRLGQEEIVGKIVRLVLSNRGRIRAQILVCEERIVHNDSERMPQRSVDELTLRALSIKPRR